ncbi:putative defense protein Hdd11 [Ctenocephalides felis]|uniref:putative defense protein Hdd11 n=1 Tax=Ctenocephalides felis TaxID=7515 RepID=UPI000E6E3CA7|nr:putative defense protein Hdd11 [Ctenocephalides felis]XP_026480325.1 putative defense protein Hdd11 [Ctenocephalides felis]
MAFRFAIVCLALAMPLAQGYSAGAPKEVCESLLPQHPYKPQSSPAPYALHVSAKQAKAGEFIEIKLQGKSAQDTIKGFIVQGRLGDEPVGTFDVSGSSQLAQTINCGSGNANAATHKKHDGADAQVISLKWSPPAGVSGVVKFKATVLLDGATFWVGLQSNEVRIN